MHLPHSPPQIPEIYLENDFYEDDESQCGEWLDYVYPNMDNRQVDCRTIVQSQVNLLDEIVGEVVNHLKVNGLWENTLLVLQSDNGGHIQLKSGAGNNYPLRGGKETDFEGGIRVISLVSGGYLPGERRGDIETGYMHVADWYTTFCMLAGVNPTDTMPETLGLSLPEVDGLDMWPLLSGQIKTSPRSEILISESTYISASYKLMTGYFKYAIRQDAVWPDSSTPNDDELANEILDCVTDGPCLFNIVNDPEERYNLANSYPTVVNAMYGMKSKYMSTVYRPRDGDFIGSYSCPEGYILTTDVVEEDGSFALHSKELPCGCWMAKYNYGGFDGPYQDLPEEYIHYTFDELPTEALTMANELHSRSSIDHAVSRTSGSHNDDSHGTHHGPGEEADTMNMAHLGHTAAVHVDNGNATFDWYMKIAIVFCLVIGFGARYCRKEKDVS